jgi:hypothetical protein
MDNQTDPQWLIGVTKTTKGTGVFAFPDQQADEFGQSSWNTVTDSRPHGLIKKALVADIRYLDCITRANVNWMIAFKWVPETIASFDQVLSSAQSCGARLCVKRCAEFGCQCIAGECK